MQNLCVGVAMGQKEIPMNVKPVSLLNFEPLNKIHIFCNILYVRILGHQTQFLAKIFILNFRVIILKFMNVILLVLKLHDLSEYIHS